MLKYYDVAVFFGGKSSENEVSVITGTMVCNVLKKGGKSVLPVYIDHGGLAYADERLADIAQFKGDGYKGCNTCALANGGVVVYKRGEKPYRQVRVGCVLNCCHGGVCEGGALAGAAALARLPFASAGLCESAVFMDKYCTKLVLHSLGVKVARYALARDEKQAFEGAQKIGYPVIVKPVSSGSSIGISKVQNKGELPAALKVAFSLDCAVLIEEYISPMREINCAAYYSGGRVITSPLEEVSSSGEILSYDDKYSGGGKRKFPADLDEKTEKAIAGRTAAVYGALNMRGIVRFDYILKTEQGKNKIYLSEVNTVPGSLSQYLLSSDYKNFYGVLQGIIKQSQEDFNILCNKRIISTGILNNITSNACKIKR